MCSIDDFKILTIAYALIEIFRDGYDETTEWEIIDGFLEDDFIEDLRAAIGTVAKYAGETEEGIRSTLTAYEDRLDATG